MLKKTNFLLFLLSTSSLFFNSQNAFARKSHSHNSKPLYTGTLQLQEETQILDANAINEKISPCENFYQFSCGAWLDKTIIPAEKKGVSRQVTPMMDSVDLKLNQILQNYASGQSSPHSSFSEKLGNYYKACMIQNTNQESQLLSMDMAKKWVTHIKKFKKAYLAEITADLKSIGVDVFFGFSSTQSLNDSSKVIGDIYQSGFALNNPDYYLLQDTENQNIRVEYKKYISKIFSLFGDNLKTANSKSQIIVEMETEMARHAYSLTDMSDPEKINHSMSLAELKKLTWAFNWTNYFERLNLKLNDLTVDEPEYIQFLNKFMAKYSEQDLLNYMVYQFLNQYAKYLGPQFQEAHFNFWNKTLNGVKQLPPTWKYCTQETEKSMGYALAEAYVNTFDGEKIKAKANEMIIDIKNAFIIDIDTMTQTNTGWLDSVTAIEAKNKVNAIAQKVGAPEIFWDYSSVNISDKNSLSNAIQLSRFETLKNFRKIDQPVDKSEWGMMPWEINAYYDRSNNEFVFPFGILMPPSLDLMASDGANYGAFGGGTIGHELIHGFDNNGSKYDAHGNLRDWWSPSVGKKFDEKAQCFITQANNYKIEQVGLTVKGERTLEENLADQGGVKLGYKALEQKLSTRAETAPWNGKYTERQQYWIAYAQSWCTKSTDASLAWQMNNDEHPPAEFRVNAVMMNRAEFAKDFQCSTGTKMSPVQRCEIW